MTWIAFAFNGVYGVALGVLILSWYLTPVLLNLFVQNYSLGNHGKVWADWHAIGCLFVGVTNLCAWQLDYNDVALRGVAWSSAAIYAIWSIQNTALCLSKSDPPRFRPFMWLHASFCALGAGLAVWAATAV